MTSDELEAMARDLATDISQNREPLYWRINALSVTNEEVWDRVVKRYSAVLTRNRDSARLEMDWTSIDGEYVGLIRSSWDDRT